jgi:hypothetical protein
MKTKVTLTLDGATWERFRIRAIQEKTSGSAIIDRLMGAYLGDSSYPARGRRAAQGKRAHVKTAKAAAGKDRKAVQV